MERVTLKPNTTYILSASGKVTTPRKRAQVGVQVFPPSVIGTPYLDFTSSQYEQQSVEFTILNNTHPFPFYLQIAGSPGKYGDVYLDDIVLVEK